ncbi:hypothetical protein IM660_16630 [Ruania alkalisoli]|uniref:Uncharacterized protein n=1 Tax=Ruania alkalisoli TaxID=2779775 RepID=A0A7M1SRN4_9MICO|nr:hypothetical protein [Ruania alkalisoli]QOR70216.1 hypothetical protein IM660_16630 [Ruania alkalisoli]
MSTDDPTDRDGVAGPGREASDQPEETGVSVPEVAAGAAGAGAAVGQDDQATAGGSANAGAAVEGEPGARASSDPLQAAGGEPGEERRIADAVDRSQVRRAPRYRNFAVLGGLLGVLIAAIATPFADETEFLGHGGLFLVVALTLAPVGILLACLLALLLDRRSR